MIVFLIKQATFVKDSSISINKVAWSPDGSLIGMSHLEATGANFDYCHMFETAYPFRNCVHETLDPLVFLPCTK